MPREPNDNATIFGAVTEQDMVCYNCIFRGELQKYPSSKCLIYNIKPFNILGGNKTTKCPAFEKDEDVDVE